MAWLIKTKEDWPSAAGVVIVADQTMIAPRGAIAHSPTSRSATGSSKTGAGESSTAAIIFATAATGKAGVRPDRTRYTRPIPTTRPVLGTIEFDGANYTDWNLVSSTPDDGPYSFGPFTYTPANSSLADFAPFFNSTNLGAQNFALDAPGAGPDGGFLWLRFADPLTGMPLDETTVVPGGIMNGSTDTRFEQLTNTWWYTGLEGTMTELGAVSNEGLTWGHLKLLFE